jgi:hypothetical protein
MNKTSNKLLNNEMCLLLNPFIETNLLNICTLHSLLINFILKKKFLNLYRPLNYS